MFLTAALITSCAPSHAGPAIENVALVVVLDDCYQSLATRTARLTAQIAATPPKLSRERISVSTVTIHGIFGILLVCKTVSQ